jgi:hypothetical protein
LRAKKIQQDKAFREGLPAGFCLRPYRDVFRSSGMRENKAAQYVSLRLKNAVVSVVCIRYCGEKSSFSRDGFHLYGVIRSNPRFGR